MLIVPHHWKIANIDCPSELLHQVFEHKKNVNPKFSLRAFARQLCCSPSSLSDILLEKSFVTPSLAINLALFLKLRRAETDFLLALTQWKLQKTDVLRAYYLDLSQRIQQKENLIKDGEIRRFAKNAQLNRLANFYNPLTNTYRQLRVYTVLEKSIEHHQLYVDSTYSKKYTNTAFIFKAEKEVFVGGHTSSKLEARVDKINPNSGSRDLCLSIDQFGFPKIERLSLTQLGDKNSSLFDLEFSLAEARAINVKTNTTTDRYRYMNNSFSSPFPFTSNAD